MDNEKGFGIVSGSAAYIAEQKRQVQELKKEKLIKDVSDEYPAFGRIYEKLKAGSK